MASTDGYRRPIAWESGGRRQHGTDLDAKLPALLTDYLPTPARSPALACVLLFSLVVMGGYEPTIAVAARVPVRDRGAPPRGERHRRHQRCGARVFSVRSRRTGWQVGTFFPHEPAHFRRSLARLPGLERFSGDAFSRPSRV